MKTEKCKPVKRNETITHDLNSCCCLAMVNGTHTQDKKEKNNSTYHHRFSFPFSVFFFLALGWPESASSILFCFEFLHPATLSLRAGGIYKIACLSIGFICRSNAPLGWPQRRSCHGLKVSRGEARDGNLSLANSNFNGKMHSSNSFEFGFLADHREKANWRSYSKVWARF